MTQTQINTAQLISLIDLTRLQEPDTVDQVVAFCTQAQNPIGPVAAVCVYPEFIAPVKQAIAIRVATVANFPSGDHPLPETLACIATSLQNGADEIDVVMPYRKLIAGDIQFVDAYLSACRNATPDVTLKIIIESGALSPQLMTQATSLVAACDADFVKTSTGKMQPGASLDAVETILQTLSNRANPPGIKISGGVREKQQALDYLKLIAHYMGQEWINPQHVRLGASQLLSAILHED